MDTKTIQAEALSRAANGQSESNYPAILAGFIDKGIAESDIKPRENIFSYRAWQALGRQVRKGEHGVKVVSWQEATKEQHGEQVSYRFPKRVAVFHVSQTDAAGGAA